MFTLATEEMYQRRGKICEGVETVIWKDTNRSCSTKKKFILTEHLQEGEKPTLLDSSRRRTVVDQSPARRLRLLTTILNAVQNHFYKHQQDSIHPLCRFPKNVSVARRNAGLKVMDPGPTYVRSPYGGCSQVLSIRLGGYMQ